MTSRAVFVLVLVAAIGLGGCSGLSTTNDAPDTGTPIVDAGEPTTDATPTAGTTTGADATPTTGAGTGTGAATDRTTAAPTPPGTTTNDTLAWASGITVHYDEQGTGTPTEQATGTTVTTTTTPTPVPTTTSAPTATTSTDTATATDTTTTPTETTTTRPPTETTTATPAPVTTTAAPTTTTETTPGQPELLQLGETYTTESLAITVDSIEFESRRNNPTPMGNTTIHIRVTVANLDDTRTGFPSPSAFQTTIGGTVYDNSLTVFSRMPLAINETHPRELVYIPEDPEVGDPVRVRYAGRAVWTTTIEELPTPTETPRSTVATQGRDSPTPEPTTTTGTTTTGTTTPVPTTTTPPPTTVPNGESVLVTGVRVTLEDIENLGPSYDSDAGDDTIRARITVMNPHSYPVEAPYRSSFALVLLEDGTQINPEPDQSYTSGELAPGATYRGWLRFSIDQQANNQPAEIVYFAPERAVTWTYESQEIPAYATPDPATVVPAGTPVNETPAAAANATAD